MVVIKKNMFSQFRSHFDKTKTILFTIYLSICVMHNILISNIDNQIYYFSNKIISFALDSETGASGTF